MGTPQSHIDELLAQWPRAFKAPSRGNHGFRRELDPAELAQPAHEVDVFEYGLIGESPCAVERGASHEKGSVSERDAVPRDSCDRGVQAVQRAVSIELKSKQSGSYVWVAEHGVDSGERIGR